MSNIKAVIFDIGGVVVGSPLLGVADYERKLNLPSHYLNTAITARGKDGAFQRLETGRIELPRFYEEFGKDLSDVKRNNEAYRVYCKKTGKGSRPQFFECPKLPESVFVDGKDDTKLWRTMMSYASTPDMAMIEVINVLKQSGKYKVAALTNNFEPLEGAGDDAMGSTSQGLREMFDVFVGSVEAGMRKPDSKFFQLVLDRLGISAGEAVFLDDIGINCKAARGMGIQTIRVDIHDSRPAIEALQRLVGDVDFGTAISDRKPKL